MRRLHILTLAFLLMVGCSKLGTVEQRIAKSVDGCKPDALCTVRIKDITDFQWEQMYIFSYGAYPEYIEKIMGMPLPDYVEFEQRIVFLNNGKVVHHESEPIDVEHIVSGQITFEGMKTEPSHLSFTPGNAVFKAEKIESDGKAFYCLTQVK